jgi:hypothetical protein
VGSLPPLLCVDTSQGREQQVGGESFMNQVEAKAVVEVSEYDARIASTFLLCFLISI